MHCLGRVNLPCQEWQVSQGFFRSYTFREGFSGRGFFSGFLFGFSPDFFLEGFIWSVFVGVRAFLGRFF